MAPLKTWRSIRAGRQAGFTYLLLLFVLALGGIGLAALGQRVSVTVQRDKEAELRFRGQAIARAIASYWQATPGLVKQYPRSWNDLLEDRRGPVTQRHLRQAYADPFTGLNDWVLISAPRTASSAGPTALPVKASAADARQDLTPDQAQARPASESVEWNAAVADAGFSAVRSRSGQRLMNIRDLPVRDPKKPARAFDLKFDAQSIATPTRPAKATSTAAKAEGGVPSRDETPE